VTVPLALGTVQFGMAYGVANATGQPDLETVRRVLDAARAGGIDLLDTAELYGTAETVLGQAGIAGFGIVSKLGPIDGAAEDLAETLAARLAAILGRLGTDRLHGLLLHRPEVLLGPDGDQVWAALEALTGTGLLGVSTYTPEETEALIERYPLGLVQLPLAPIDRRWDGTLARLRARHVEVHTRSALLQGLLAMPAAARPPHFARWQGLLDGWDAWVRDRGLAPAAAALGLVRARHDIDRVVVGVETAAQLGELLAAPPLGDVLPEALTTDDPALLNPALWP
jgi:aryl-alcohol dehydrogenase-like predicted oxidoreductase